LSKPKSKAEAMWIHWRNEYPNTTEKFSKWSKKQMNRARRKFNKKIKEEEIEDGSSN